MSDSETEAHQDDVQGTDEAPVGETEQNDDQSTNEVEQEQVKDPEVNENKAAESEYEEEQEKENSDREEEKTSADLHDEPDIRNDEPLKEDEKSSSGEQEVETNRLDEPVDRNREPSEELEYEPSLDEQTHENDGQPEGTSTEIGLEQEKVETPVQPEYNTAPNDNIILSEEKEVAADKEQILETSVAQATPPEPVLPTPKENPVEPVKRQVSWEPDVETLSMEQRKARFEVDQRSTVGNADWKRSTSGLPTPGRLVYNAVPSMNSQISEPLSQVTDMMTSMSVTADDSATKRAKPYQSALYRRKPDTYPSSQPVYIQPSYGPATQPVSNVSGYIAPRERPDMWSTYSTQSAIRAVAPTPPPSSSSVRSAQMPVQATAPPQTQYPTPTRKTSGTPPYIGSQVIATETGPSCTVLLRRPTSERHWGFTFYGGSESGCPPFVNKVTVGSLAAQHGIEVGDVIVSICNSLTVGKTQEQLKADILRAGNELDLVLIRRGVDLNKIAQLAPKALPTTPQSPMSASSNLLDRQFSFTSQTARTSRSTESSVSRGRSFRSIKTKSLRILEEQLSSGQSPSSVVQTKQHFQGARGLPASGTASTIMQAYGQTPYQGYLGRTTTSSVADSESFWTGTEQVVPVKSVPYAQPAYTPYEPSHFSEHAVTRWNQSGSHVGRPNWETQSYGGQSSGWAMPTPNYTQSATINTPQSVVYPNPSYTPGNVYTPSANITVPAHSRPQWPNRP